MEETKTLQEEYSPTDAKREKVRRVAVAMIDDFPEHPFKVKDDEEMEKLKDSISLYGVLTPVVARRCENGRYELISGHRRKYVCKALGIEFIPAIVREMSREEAVIAMVDSNLQREHILPSEKAFAYKMKMDALRKKAGRRACGQNPGQGERKGLCTQGSKRKRHLQCMMQRNPSQRSFAGWDIRRSRRCTHGLRIETSLGKSQTVFAGSTPQNIRGIRQ